MVIQLQSFEFVLHLLHLSILFELLLLSSLKQLPARLFVLSHLALQIADLFILLLVLQFDCLELIFPRA